MRKNSYTNERNDQKQSIMEMETKTKIIAQTIEKKRMLLNNCTSLNIYTVCINWNSL